jgi:serine/threonine protein kinase/tetratricopeptide (TPR) repeat protein
MASLFLSYRRADSPDTVKLIHERLKKRLPRWEIFYDHESIPLGEQFPDRLRAKVTSATAVLVIIGPKWLEILRERRNAPIDHVRVEVQLALEAGASVVPVLVGTAAMLTDADLADFADLQPLLKRNGRPVRPDPDFDADLEPIVAHLKSLDSAEAVGTILDDKYTLTAEIGVGGMGVVYLAQQKQPVQRTVAIKLIKPGMDSRDVLARFDAERQALAVMDHPNIAKVLDAGMAASGRPYFVMEHVKGVPITQYCDDKKLTPQERLNLFIPVCNAVQHAHQKGIIHRDLKPSNVLVEVVDGKPVPKVIDFGLAKALGQKLTDKTLYTALDTRVGTLEYSAPEQAAGRTFDIDTRSDIYSLGVLLYELLTGATPFTHADLLRVGEEEMRRVIREDEPTKPSKKLSSSGELPAIAANRHLEPAMLTRLVQGDLDWIVMKCLEKENTRRYETANQLGQEIQRFLADEPVQARPPSASYRMKKFIRRNRGPVIAAAVVVLALFGGIIGTSIGLVMAERAREAEAKQRQIAETNESKANKAAEDANKAAIAEKKAKETAQEKEAETGAVLEFVENKVFAAARPQNLGPKVTLRRAVEDALPFVDKSFTKQPLIEARLRMTLGISFWYLGDAGLARGQFEVARALYTKHLGPDHPDTLRTMNNLGNSYADLGRYADALKLREETLALMRARFGPDHPDTLRGMHNLAAIFADLGRYADALKLFDETLALRKAKLGPDHPDTLSNMNSLAFSYATLGRHADALKLREETLALIRTKFGPDHPDTLTSMNSLANSYYDLGRDADALKLYDETLALRKVKLGPDHPDTLLSMNNLASSYGRLGRHADALKLYEETLALQKAKLGPEHRDTLFSMNNLASSYGRLGRHADALKLREETLALMKGKLGPDHPDTLRTMYNLAFSYAALGRDADALKLREETLALMKAKLGPDHPDTLLNMWMVAKNLVKLDRGAEALPIIDECVQRAAGKDVDPDLFSGVMDLRLRHFEKKKDAAGCRATAKMWEKLKRTDAGSLYDASCMRAVTAAMIRAADKSAAAAKEAGVEADRSMAWLKQAVAAGYNDAAHMKQDTDLDALRQRPDFQKLLAELEAGKGKKKK